MRRERMSGAVSLATRSPRSQQRAGETTAHRDAEPPPRIQLDGRVLQLPTVVRSADHRSASRARGRGRLPARAGGGGDSRMAWPAACELWKRPWRRRENGGTEHKGSIARRDYSVNIEISVNTRIFSRGQFNATHFQVPAEIGRTAVRGSPAQGSGTSPARSPESKRRASYWKFFFQ